MNRLCLGTVQFGMDYGINNPAGQPSKAEVFAMLDAAIASGIDCLDTAAAYGEAEALLGQYGMQDKQIKVISKLRPHCIADDERNIATAVEKELHGTLERLELSCLDGYLLHTPEYFYNESVIFALKRLKEKGLVKHIGVSVYETAHALDVVKSGAMDYIQIMYSIFDQRLDKTDFFAVAKANHVTVFARSAFLQGLILMQEERIPEQLSEARAYLKDFDAIIARYHLSRAQAAFLFSYTHPGIDYLVFGVEAMSQLQEDIAFSQKDIDFDQCRYELKQSFLGIGKTIIFPSLWKTKR